LYNMKRMTASEARRHWFSVLDRVARGEVIAVERGGRLIVLRRENAAPADTTPPDYREVLRVPHADQADRWGWEWSPRGKGLRLRRRPA
jgi:antitoxin (DNA-binding transcriptional repressor) of toxin-antitoxin stability system